MKDDSTLRRNKMRTDYFADIDKNDGTGRRHYNVFPPGYQPDDVIREWLYVSPGLPARAYWLWGNVLKYAARWPHKGQRLSDIKKLIDYAARLHEMLSDTDVEG